MTITATNAATASIFNSATARFAIVNNRPPDAAGAVPTIPVLWPPDHRMVEVGIAGITDPDGDAVAVRIIAITQSEPTEDMGDGNFCPDAAGGTETALLRAERRGGGSGRLYIIEFVAEDGHGGETTGTVTVSVPKSAAQPATDTGLRFASGQCK